MTLTYLALQKICNALDFNAYLPPYSLTPTNLRVPPTHSVIIQTSGFTILNMMPDLYQIRLSKKKDKTFECDYRQPDVSSSLLPMSDKLNPEHLQVMPQANPHKLNQATFDCISLNAGVQRFVTKKSQHIV